MIETDRRGFRAPGTTFMISGGLIGAVGAFVFQAYGGRQLGTESFAPIAQLWTAFFIIATVLLVPVEQYITREVASGRKVIPDDLRAAAAVSLIGALLGGGFVYLTLDRLFAGNPTYIWQMVLLMIGYGLLFVGKGVLAGRRHFAGVGWLLIIETLVRLVAGVVFLAISPTAVSLGWAMVAGGFAIVGMGWWRHDRGAPAPPTSPPAMFLGGYVGGTASSQVLLGAAPIVVALLGGDEALQSVVFATFTLFRAPLTLIFALQGRILPFLVGLAGAKDHSRLTRFVRYIVILGILLTFVGGAVGWLIGPQVVGFLYHSGFEPSSMVAMLVAGGVMAAATAQIAGQVLVAEARTARLATAWFGGLIAAAIAVVFLPGEPDVRVALAFAIGEVVSLASMAFLAVSRRAAANLAPGAQPD